MKLVIEAKDVGLEIDLNEVRAAIRPTPKMSHVAPLTFEDVYQGEFGAGIFEDKNKEKIRSKKKPGRKPGRKPKEQGLNFGNGKDEGTIPTGKLKWVGNKKIVEEPVSIVNGNGDVYERG